MKNPQHFNQCFESPLGFLNIISTKDEVKALRFEDTIQPQQPNTLTELVKRQLSEYFAKKREKFDLPLAPEGTTFQEKVWEQLLKIPFGQTISYRKLSQMINNEKAIRAVGKANGQNPIPIIIPCHRVIGSNGDLTGYSGGLWRKKILLKREGLLPQKEIIF